MVLWEYIGVIYGDHMPFFPLRLQAWAVMVILRGSLSIEANINFHAIAQPEEHFQTSFVRHSSLKRTPNLKRKSVKALKIMQAAGF